MEFKVRIKQKKLRGEDPRLDSLAQALAAELSREEAASAGVSAGAASDADAEADVDAADEPPMPLGGGDVDGARAQLDALTALRGAVHTAREARRIAAVNAGARGRSSGGNGRAAARQVARRWAGIGLLIGAVVTLIVGSGVTSWLRDRAARDGDGGTKPVEVVTKESPSSVDPAATRPGSAAMKADPRCAEAATTGVAAGSPSAECVVGGAGSSAPSASSTRSPGLGAPRSTSTPLKAPGRVHAEASGDAPLEANSPPEF